MKKRWMAIFLCLLLLTGCSGYDRDDSPGQIIYITLDDMKAMMEDKKEFVIAFTQSLCVYCQNFHELFSEYSKHHHVVIYEVLLDNELGTPSQNRAIIQEYFPAFDTTPGIFYAKDGKVYDQLSNIKITEEVFDNWVQKNQLDKKE
ncbi:MULTISPECIES: hypothetical protein [Erysipelotrichaceae]|jgi:thiol-disulfide isomerase/thioredoxin|uniref:hypothetical protein n=1 Tax=Erysipelotrichaceae TaxID=128827 RepID=UPI000E407E55|nr:MULTISPECIES: hypothetical protein [unclassified Absiella]RGC52867.1 hypothetical protein DW761_04260 [Absiella sp. AM29-15]RHU03865.1 hypothetical protein DW716_14990 [Absiella sp. AM27-20]